MKKWVERILSDVFLRTAIIFLCITMILAICCLSLFLIPLRLFTDWVSILTNIFMILMIISGGFCIVFAVIMMIRITIYGNEVKHDKIYWTNFSSKGEALSAKVKQDPYLLAIRYKNPIPGFIIGMFFVLSIPTIVLSKKMGFTSAGIKQIAIIISVIYALIIVMVFFIRLYRRLRAFHVKIYKNT